MAQLFTLAEAQATLPRVRELLEAAQRAKRELDDAALGLEALKRKIAGNGHTSHEGELAQARSDRERSLLALRVAVEAIQELGIELKDVDRGLVDFPSEREGRVVYLCWHLGESTIGYWHELDAGYRGRQPL